MHRLCCDNFGKHFNHKRVGWLASILFAGWAREVLMCHGISPDRVGAAARATVTHWHRGRAT